jgi:hypothetical protein
MTPDSCGGAERNMGLSPPLLLSGSRSGGVESPSEPSPLPPCLICLDCKSFQAMACSRPPLPTTNTFTVYFYYS